VGASRTGGFELSGDRTVTQVTTLRYLDHLPSPK